ncbi:Reverse transcriptase domain [Arabidopsis suecica]|uniref:Reverse transcriptase domain n=1 Tax=Arabidopsis suecica TaxID=45249 RepID=A0A8T1ZD48_ARASU|nr:Reverse transcriptase domain [Arabidopsis suecica]
MTSTTMLSLANLVVVKKKNGKWRVCVDFTDLNKACPKDNFSLPHIDQLVEATAGNKLLSFMDAFAGYNQILMHPDDREKTPFITDRGIYCYEVMPFGLKIAGATYQRLVNRVFSEQLEKMMEVYIDDMLVKSLEENDHVAHLRDCFRQLNQHNMKLNPAKCHFAVKSGEFLGYLVTHRGIEANPKQIDALLNMPSPQNKREVQRLTGRVAALNRFISRSTDKCLAFYDTLRGNKKFEWTDRCEEAFQELKKYLANPPVMAKPERFPKERKSKLSPRGDGQFRVLENINDNAYKLELPEGGNDEAIDLSSTETDKEVTIPTMRHGPLTSLKVNQVPQGLKPWILSWKTTVSSLEHHKRWRSSKETKELVTCSSRLKLLPSYRFCKELEMRPCSPSPNRPMEEWSLYRPKSSPTVASGTHMPKCCTALVDSPSHHQHFISFTGFLEKRTHPRLPHLITTRVYIESASRSQHPSSHSTILVELVGRANPFASPSFHRLSHSTVLVESAGRVSPPLQLHSIVVELGGRVSPSATPSLYRTHKSRTNR